MIGTILVVLASAAGIIALYDLVTSQLRTAIKSSRRSKQQQCEEAVTDALRTLDMKSYVVFENLILPSSGNTSYPNARSVKIDGEQVDCSISEIKRKISCHTKAVYNLSDCEHILKTFAVASSKRAELKHLHAEEVRNYLQKANV